MGFGGFPSFGKEGGEGFRTSENVEEAFGEGGGVFAVGEVAVLAVADEVHGLSDAGGDEGDAGGHGFEDGLGAAFLAGGDEVGVEGVVEVGDVGVGFEVAVGVGDVEFAEFFFEVASGGSAEEDVEGGDVVAEAGEGLGEDVGAFDELGFEAVAPAFAVFLEGADDEGVGGDAKGGAGAAFGFGGLGREKIEVDADGDAVELFGGDAGFEEDVLHFGVADLEAVNVLVVL